MEMPGAQHLRPQHLFELLPSLVGEHAVGQHPHAVDHAPQRRQVGVDPGQHLVDGRRVGRISQLDLHRHSLLAEPVDGLLCFGIRGPSPVQYDCPCASLGQPAGHRASDAPHAPGHQVGPVISQLPGFDGGTGEDELADVAGGLHVLHRCARFGQRPSGVYQGRQFARRHLVHHPPESVSGHRRSLLLESVQLQDPVAHVGPSLRHLLFAENVHPGEFHEAAISGQAGQAGVDEARAGEAVEHHVDSLAPGGLEDFLTEVGLAAVEHVLHAQRPQKRLFRSTGGGENLSPRGLGQLNRGQPHAPCPGVDQNPLARLQPGQIE